LHGYDGDTGAVIYAGGGPNELMANTRKWNTGIVARGRIYFAADNKVYAFAMPTATPTPTPLPSPTPTATPPITPTPIPTPTPNVRRLLYNGGMPFVNGTNLVRGTRYTVTAETNPYTLSAVFERDRLSVKTDSATPFDFTWTPMAIGTHTFVATPWSSSGGTGTSGRPRTVNFNVIAAATPTATP
jgi:hypothetical protein